MQVYLVYLPYVPQVAVLIESECGLALRYLVARLAVCILSVRLERGLEDAPASVETGILRLSELAREVLSELPLVAEETEPAVDESRTVLVEKLVPLSDKHPKVTQYLGAEYQSLLECLESRLRHTEGASAEDIAYQAILRLMYKFLSFAESQCRKGNTAVAEDPASYHRFLYGKCLKSALIEELRARPAEGRIASVNMPGDGPDDGGFEEYIGRDSRAKTTGHVDAVEPGLAQHVEEPDEEVPWTDVEIQQCITWVERLHRFFHRADSHREHAFSLWQVLLQFPECLSEEGFTRKVEEFLYNRRRNAWCDEVTRRTGWGLTAKTPVARNKAVSRIRDALRRAWEVSADDGRSLPPAEA